MEKKDCKIIAHRGASFDAPENTLAAINLAWKQNADAVEIDLHLSADGQIVVIHDDTTFRTAGKNKPVRNQSLNELKLLDAGGWKNPHWRNERIPALEEVLKTIPENKSVFLEIKSGQDCLPDLETVIKRSGLSSSRITIMDFNPDTLQKAKSILPDHPILWLTEFSCQGLSPDPPLIHELCRQAAAMGADGINLEANRTLNPEMINMAEKLNLQVYVWTVNSIKEAQYYKSIGMNGIITDRPGFLKKNM